MSCFVYTISEPSRIYLQFPPIETTPWPVSQSVNVYLYLYLMDIVSATMAIAKDEPAACIF